MHKKILITDHSLVFIGSANFTPTSLRMHDNIVVGLYQKDLAAFIEDSLANHLSFKIGVQDADFWHLPDFQNQCLEKILSSIHQSKKTIHIALFTFTHPKIIEALLKAKERGVNILIAIDWYSSQGASKKAVAILKKNGITPLISQKGKLLHYKWALIDEKTLFLGSANWTKSAFSHNEDCIFSLQDLNKNQVQYFTSLWNQIKKNSLQ
jgi:cardiolipin synthase A/B